MDEFMEHLKVLEQLKDVWTRGKSAAVVEVPDHEEPCAGDLSGMLEQNKHIEKLLGFQQAHAEHDTSDDSANHIVNTNEMGTNDQSFSNGIN